MVFESSKVVMPCDFGLNHRKIIAENVLLLQKLTIFEVIICFGVKLIYDIKNTMYFLALFNNLDFSTEGMCIF